MKPTQSWLPELPPPANLTRASKEITAAWESFINGVTIAGPKPRPVVLEGWMRCRAHGINPRAERALIDITPEELLSILHNDDLGRAGKSILDKREDALVTCDGNRMRVTPRGRYVLHSICGVFNRYVRQMPSPSRT